MKCWHYNLVSIVKDKEFQQVILDTLTELEPDNDSVTVLSMLKNYFNIRNTDFGSNWLDLPTCGITLHLDSHGIYYKPTEGAIYTLDICLDRLNNMIKDSVSLSTWTITFVPRRH